jgi:non-heme chloroperoxidase
VAKTVLIGAAPPPMLKTPANPGGLPMEVFDQIRAGVLADRSQFFKDLTMPFYGNNRPGAKVSEGVRNSFWLQGMMVGFPAAYFCIKAFSEIDQTEDLKKFDVPTLIMHGNDDRMVPISASAMQVIQADRERATEGLQAWCARYVYYAKGRGQCRSACVLQGVSDDI